MQKQKMKHNYTSELELKSLLIRIKNDRIDLNQPRDNAKINKYIKWFTAVNAKKYPQNNKIALAKRSRIKTNLKQTIITKSENSSVDQESYERFGAIILLMITNILKKPQFSGYTYKDDFYSDAVYKILKYLHNFNHHLISERTGQKVNAFAYISQIIHNSILFIINSKKKEMLNRKKHIEKEAIGKNLNLPFNDWYAPDTDIDSDDAVDININLSEIETTLYDEIESLENDIDGCTSMVVTYPASYVITFEEYNELKHMLKGKVSITRANDE